MSLDSNSLVGAIPSELATLTGLQQLELANNWLSCNIPDLSPLGNLLDLRLQNNRLLGGTLPENVINIWSNMSVLDIGCTGIRIPDTLGFKDWLNGITFSRSGCTETIQAACPSDPTVPVDQIPAVPVDQVNPVVPVVLVKLIDPAVPVDLLDPVVLVDLLDPVVLVDLVDPADPADPVDQADPAVPVDLTGSEKESTESAESSGGGGGCAIAPNAGASKISQGILFNLIPVMSMLLTISWRKFSWTKETGYFPLNEPVRNFL